MSLPAGGPDPDRFDVTEAWYRRGLCRRPRQNPSYPIHPLRSTHRHLVGPLKAKPGECLRDKCPHRPGPPVLKVELTNPVGGLECPYHGWAFSGSGTCEHIPPGL